MRFLVERAHIPVGDSTDCHRHHASGCDQQPTPHRHPNHLSLPSAINGDIVSLS